MKRRFLIVLCAFVLMATPLLAGQGGPKPKSTKPPKPPQTSVSKSVKPTTTKAKPVSAKPTTSKAPKPVKATSSKPVKSTTKSTKPATTTTTKSAKAEGKGNKKTTTTDATTTGTTPTTSTPGETVELTKVQQKLKKNTNLAAKLEQRLGSSVDLMDAADGFKNLGQFVAAVNASYNHEGIEFTELKTLMVDEGFSLGQAMQKLKAENATTEARRAETEANKMIETSEREIAAPTGVTAKPVTTSTTSSTSSSSTTTVSAKKKNSKKTTGAQQ